MTCQNFQGGGGGKVIAGGKCPVPPTPLNALVVDDEDLRIRWENATISDCLCYHLAYNSFTYTRQSYAYVTYAYTDVPLCTASHSLMCDFYKGNF